MASLAKCMVKYIETDPILHTLGIHNHFVNMVEYGLVVHNMGCWSMGLMFINALIIL